MEHTGLIRQRSLEKTKAKRESIQKHRHECAESGDDEDEELGDAAVREKSPRSAINAGYRGSKLGTEMMRTNSRGSVVSVSDLNTSGDIVEPPPTVSEELPAVSEIKSATSTPPELSPPPSGKVSGIDLNETPKPASQTKIDPTDDAETPRAPSVASNPPTRIFETMAMRLKGGASSEQ
jgi:serine/threonine-protein kinase RIM15